MIASNPFGQGRVLIEDDVVSALDQFRQRVLGDPEAGGLLLGFRRGPHLHVTEFTPPYPTDRRTRTSFKRACEGHAEAALRRWRATDEHLDYVGEWHSHPEEHASPSAVDLREWRTLLRERHTPLVFLILGLSADWLGVGQGLNVLIALEDKRGSCASESKNGPHT